MMSDSLNKQDGFFELMQTQKVLEVPQEIEARVMMSILPEKTDPLTTFNLQSFFVFGLLSCIYVLVAFISNAYYPYNALLSDIKLLILTSILVYTIYKLNENGLDLLRQLFVSHKLSNTH